jgi:hypothetical protein
LKLKDPIVEVPQTICWYEGLRVALGQKKPYGIEKMVEPEAFRQRSSGFSHNNKWSRYKVGLHLPQRSVREKGERVCPGSSAVLLHPLWKIASLRPEKCIAEFADEWLRDLGQEIRPWFFRHASVGAQEVRRGISERKLLLLRQRADLDALAALSILLREAAENHRYKLSMAIGDALFRTLLQCSVCAAEPLKVALPKIFEMLVERVFPLACDRHHAICFEGLDIATFCSLFQRAIHQLRIACGKPPGTIGTNEVDRVVDLGFKMKPFPWLCFSKPIRPLDRHKDYVRSEERFCEFIHAWQRVGEQMQNLESLAAY